LVEADEDTDVEVGGDPEAGSDAGGAAKSRRKTRLVVAKQSAATAATAVSAVKAVEKRKKKRKRKRKTSPPPAVETPAILTPQSRGSSRKKKKKMRPSRICRLWEIRRRGGQRAPLPRGSRIWCRRRRKMSSVKVWRRSELLLQHKQSFLY
jgi:hypothetical protein